MSSQSEGNHQKNRNFICSCGKGYLSYAALFTHIKQKHGGKAPGDIVRPRSQNKRGRPRKNEKMLSEKGLKSQSNIEVLENNNLKNTKFMRGLNFNQLSSSFQLIEGKPFHYNKDHKEVKKSKNQLNRRQQQHSDQNQNELYEEISQSFDQDENMQFANPNNQFSMNTLTFANIIIGLREIFQEDHWRTPIYKSVLEKLAPYRYLQQFHSEKLSENSILNDQSQVFMLGNVICAFLNFCQQTITDKNAYDQIVVLMVCIVENIKIKKRGNILKDCSKEAIHECMPSFFQQYIDKAKIRNKLYNYWIFFQNNTFRVTIWFLNWLSSIEANYKKTSDKKQTRRPIEKQAEQAFLTNPLLFRQASRNSDQILEKEKEVERNFRKRQTRFNKEHDLKKEDEQISQKQNQIQCQFQNFIQTFPNDYNEKPSQKQSDQNYDPQDQQNLSQSRAIAQNERLSSEVH